MKGYGKLNYYFNKMEIVEIVIRNAALSETYIWLLCQELEK